MALARWTPRKDVEKFFESFFDEPFSFESLRRLPSYKKMKEFMTASPAVDMYDNDKEIVVKAEVPGMDRKDINISVTDNTLTIKGEIKKEDEVKEEDYYYAERSYGGFKRMLELPEKVDDSKIKAKIKDGILEIHLPKSPEAKAKEIKIDMK